MGGFAHIDAAAAMREIIGEAAKKVIATDAPRPNYGRVITVNTSALTATVWFPGDEAPVSVKMFPNTVPGAWHEKFGVGSGSGITNTSYVGYGSQVAVQDFNGSLYITQVLTGGILSASAAALGLSNVTQEATDIAADQTGKPIQIVGEPHETFINCHIHNDTLPDGGAIQFGPFTALNSTLPGIGWIEVTVVELSGSAKVYRFPNNPIRDFERTGGTDSLDSWFRVVPEQQINDNGGQVIDFDFEIAIKRTAYGDIDEFFQEAELWMRVIKRGTAWTGLNCKVAIRATNIQRGRALSGRELFMQEALISPPEARGYVGFHNSQMVFRDFNDYGVLDNFGRTVTGGWGTSDSGPVWLVRGSGAAQFGVDGQSAYINFSGNFSYTITLQQSNVLNTDTYWDVSCAVMPTGAEVQTAHVTRWVDANNMYQFKVIFTTAGTVTVGFIKGVAGVFTSIGPDYVTGLTFTAGEKFRCRARINGSALFMKIWKPATQREPDWQKVEIDASLGANAGNFTGFIAFPGGANTNTKPFKVNFDNIRASLYAKGQDNSGSQWHTGPWRSGLLRVAQNLQQTWMCTGQMLWDGSRLRWTDRIYFGGIGQHRLALAAGSAMMQSPPSGFTVPVVPNGGTVSVNGSGIPLNAGQSLWVGIPPGQTWENLYEYLFIVDNVAAINYDLPEWATLIAMRSDTNTTGPQLRLGNGVHLDSWRTLTPMNGWNNTGYPHVTGRYRRVESPPNSLQIMGSFTPGTKADGTILFQLPTNFMPASHITVPLSSAPPTLGTFTPMLQIEITGDCKVYGLVAGTNIIYLNAVIPLDT